MSSGKRDLCVPLFDDNGWQYEKSMFKWISVKGADHHYCFAESHLIGNKSTADITGWVYSQLRVQTASNPIVLIAFMLHPSLVQILSIQRHTVVEVFHYIYRCVLYGDMLYK